MHVSSCLLSLAGDVCAQTYIVDAANGPGTELGDLVVLAVGLAGPRSFLFGLQDPFWLDPAVHVFVALGVQQAAAPVTGSVFVPNNPAFVGTRLHWQAACQGPVTGFRATNPVATLVH